MCASRPGPPAAPPPGPGGPVGWGACGDHQFCGDPCPLAADTTVTAAFSRSVFTYHACQGHANRLARSLRLLGAHTVDVTTPPD